MKANLHRIAGRLYAEPWMIREDKYAVLEQQFRAAAAERGDLRIRVLKDNGEPEDDDERMRQKLSQQADMDCLSELEIARGIAIVPVSGILGKHLDWMDTYCGGYDIANLERQAMALMNRMDVHTVVTHWNTPGGAAAGVADCAQVLLEMGAVKRHVAYIDDACSGGYFLACTAAEVYSGKSATAGSISAFCKIADVSAMYAEMGVKIEVFADGDLKAAGVEGTTLTEAQRSDIQGRVEHIGGMFKDFVRSRRPTVQDDAMRGQWFYGDQALQAGLVDGLAPTLAHVVAALLD